jgi:hypothetical protein
VLKILNLNIAHGGHFGKKLANYIFWQIKQSEDGTSEAKQ